MIDADRKMSENNRTHGVVEPSGSGERKSLLPDIPASPPPHSLTSPRPHIPSSYFTRIISLTLIVSMVFCDPVFASVMPDFIRSSFSHDLENLTIPSKFGAITDKWVSAESR